MKILNIIYLFIFEKKFTTIFLLTRQGTKVDKKRVEVKPFVCICDFITKYKKPTDKPTNNNLKTKSHSNITTKKKKILIKVTILFTFDIYHN